MAQISSDSPKQAIILTNLGIGLIARYTHFDNLVDLDRAIEVYEEAVAQTASDSSEQAVVLTNLGISVLTAHYARTGDLADLNRAIAAYEQAAAQTSRSPSEQTALLDSLSSALRDRYTYTEELADLDRAIEVSEQAVAQTPSGSPDLPGYHDSLGIGLSTRYAHTSDLDDLERAIEAYEETVARTSSGSPDLPSYLNNLGVGLRARYNRTGDLTDLKRAIEVYEQAIAQTSPGSLDLPMYLNNLSNGLRDRYILTGDSTDLDRAIEVCEQAIAQTSPGSPGLPMYLNNLSNGLRDRYDRIGDLADLNKAISASEQAVTQTPQDSPALPSRLNNLSIGLNARYCNTEDLADLDKAIEVSEQAVAQTPQGSPDLPMYLNNLGIQLRTRHARTGDLADLDRIIADSEQAMAQTSPGSPALPSYLTNLGNVLGDRYVRAGDMADLDKAIEAYEQAVSQTPPGSPALPARLTNLGRRLSNRYAHTGDLADLHRAITAYEAVCQQRNEVAPEQILRAALYWGDWALEREQWVEAAQAYGYGQETIERLYGVQLTRQAKETRLRQTRGLSARAAYALARSGDTRAAVVAVEQGRARLLAEALERDRTDLTALRQAYPTHHADYCRAADRIAILSRQELHLSDLPLGFDLLAELRAARADLNAATEAIRALPDHADFLSAVDWDHIAAAVRPDCPLIYLIATDAGGLAIIVGGTRQVSGISQVSPILVDLPALTEVTLHERLLGTAGAPQLGGYLGAYSDYQSALDAYRRAEREADAQKLPKEERETYLRPFLEASEVAYHLWFTVLDETCRWLWNVVMEPLITALPSGTARVTLIPAGLLGLLPLHAAHDVDGTRCVLDEFACAYAPSARLLSHAQQVAATATGERLFAVDNPDGSLRFSSKEVNSVAGHFAEPWVACGDRATRNTALAALAECDVYHFSCHGANNWAAPLDSALTMYGGVPLATRDLLGQKQLQARLAFLSACETGLIGAELPDEMVGLVAGFLQAGAAGVVSTLWAVNDESTAWLAARFYENWKDGGMEPAAALTAAQRWLRDEACGGQWEHPHYWAGFTLSGV